MRECSLPKYHKGIHRGTQIYFHEKCNYLEESVPFFYFLFLHHVKNRPFCLRTRSDLALYVKLRIYTAICLAVGCHRATLHTLRTKLCLLIIALCIATIDSTNAAMLSHSSTDNAVIFHAGGPCSNPGRGTFFFSFWSH